MAHDYANIDLHLRKSSSMYIFNDLTKNSLDAQVVPFQFPPIIKSDSKRANWQEENIASYEPFAVWMGSDARRLEIQLEYVVTSRVNLFNGLPDDNISAPDNGTGGVDVWSVANIMNIMRKLKSYFYITVERGRATYPLVKAVFYEYSPNAGDDALTNRLGTWRLHDVNIQPSGTLIVDGDQVCHLKHTISFGMSLTTQLLSLTDGGSKDENEQKVEIDALKLQAQNSRDRTGVINPWF